jgi:hypothetical protein
MGDLSDRDVEDILGGVQPAGRDDLAPIVDLTTWLRASREIEPPPAMGEHLFWQIELGRPPLERTPRRPPQHLGVPSRRGLQRLVPSPLGPALRPVASVAAAAALLVGLLAGVEASRRGAAPAAVASEHLSGAPAAGAGTTSSTPPAGAAASRDETSTSSSSSTSASPPVDTPTADGAGAARAEVGRGGSRAGGDGPGASWPSWWSSSAEAWWSWTADRGWAPSTGSATDRSSKPSAGERPPGGKWSDRYDRAGDDDDREDDDDDGGDDGDDDGDDDDRD